MARKPCSEDCVCVPGPHATTETWTLTVCDDGYPMVNTPGDIVCNDDPNHHPGCKVSLERFRLIAAAPDLLAALKRLIPTNINLDHPNLKDDLTVPCDVTLGELRAARDAISQATGAS